MELHVYQSSCDTVIATCVEIEPQDREVEGAAVQGPTNVLEWPPVRVKG